MQDGTYLTLSSSVLLQTITPLPKFKVIILFLVWLPKCLKAFVCVFDIWKLSVCISGLASPLKISRRFFCLYRDCQCCNNNCLNVWLHKFEKELKIRGVQRWADFCQAGQSVDSLVWACQGGGCSWAGAGSRWVSRCTHRQGCKENEERGTVKGSRFLQQMSLYIKL